MFQTPLLSQFPAILQSGSVIAAQQWLVERLGAGVTQADVEEMGNLVASRNMARDPQARSVLDSLIAEKAGVDLARLTAPSAAQSVPAFLLFQKAPPRELQAGVFLAAPSFKPSHMQVSASEAPTASTAVAENSESLPTPEEIIPNLSSTLISKRGNAAIRGSLILEHLETRVRRTMAAILGKVLVDEPWKESLLEAAKRFAFYEELDTLMTSIFGSDKASMESQELIEELLEYLFQQRQGGDQTLLLQVLIGKLPTAHPSLKPLLIRFLFPRVENVFSAFGPYLAEKYPGTVRRTTAVCLAQALPRLEKIPFDLVLEIFEAVDFEHAGKTSEKILSSLGTVIPKLGEEEKMELARRAAKHSLADFISDIGPHVQHSRLPEIVELALAALLNRRHYGEDIAKAIVPLDAKEELRLARKLKKKYLREEMDSAEIVFYLEAVEWLLSESDETTPASLEKSSGEKTLAPFAESARGLLKHPDTEVREASLDFLKEIFPRLEAEEKIRAVEALEQIPANDLPEAVCGALAAALPHLEEGALQERALSLGKRILDAEAGDFSWGDSLSALLHQMAEAHLEKFKEPESLRELYQFFQGWLFSDPGKLHATAAAAVIALSTYFGPEERMAQIANFGGLLVFHAGDDTTLIRIYDAFKESRDKFTPAEQQILARLIFPIAQFEHGGEVLSEGSVKSFVRETDYFSFACLIGQLICKETNHYQAEEKLHLLYELIPSIKDSREILTVALILVPALENSVIRAEVGRFLVGNRVLPRLEKQDLETLGLKVAGLLKKIGHRDDPMDVSVALFGIYSAMEDSAQRHRLLMSLEEMLWRENEEDQNYGEEVFLKFLSRSELPEEYLLEIVKFLKPKLKDPRPQNRRVAVGILGEIGEVLKSREILEMLLPLFADDDEAVRKKVKNETLKIFDSLSDEDQLYVVKHKLWEMGNFRKEGEEQKALDVVDTLKRLAIRSKAVRFELWDILVEKLWQTGSPNDDRIREAVVEALSDKDLLGNRRIEWHLDRFLDPLEKVLVNLNPKVRLAVVQTIVAVVGLYASQVYWKLSPLGPHFRTLAGALAGEESEEIRAVLLAFFERWKESREEGLRQFAERVVATFSPPKSES